MQWKFDLSINRVNNEKKYVWKKMNIGSFLYLLFTIRYHILVRKILKFKIVLLFGTVIW